MRVKAFLLEVDHVMRKECSALRLFLKTESGKSFRLYDESFAPYFYLNSSLSKAESLLTGMVNAKRVEAVEKLCEGVKKKLVKVIAFTASDVPKLKHEAKRLGDCFEYDIPFTRRYVIDHQLKPNKLHEVVFEGKLVKSITPLSENKKPVLKILSLDIETYNPDRISDPKKDACLMIGFYGEKKGVYSYSKKFSSKLVTSFSTEKEMLESFTELVKKEKIDVLCSYNGDQFDLPFLQARADKLNAAFSLSRDGSRVKTRKAGIRLVSKLGGRIHYDVFPVVSFLNFIGTIHVPRLRLEEVYFELLGGKKLDLDKAKLWKLWDDGKTKELDYLAEYNLVDAKACFELTEKFLPLQLELGALVGMPLFDCARATSSQLVETFLLRKAFSLNEIAPNKPVDVKAEPIEGAFVKTPEAGVYDNLAMLDFKSLYPSIIISHNIDYSALNCDCCKDAFVSPQGHRFCRKRKGIMPLVLGEVLDERFKLKDAMKKLDKKSSEYSSLDAQQWGLKILANSAYGYQLFARSRWYSRACGEATTAWAREFIHKTIKAAEEKGLKVIYTDTDSILVKYEKKNLVEEFMKEFNKTLPSRMELDLEDYYSRGIFVSKKVSGKEVGAKKKYALISDSGRIKIKGFELVRRDWSKIARRTQKKVLEILLKEGSVEKAVALVRKVVIDLKEEIIPLEDCVIYSGMRKKKYLLKSPAVSAFEYAKKTGLQVSDKVIDYVITKDGKSISDKARVFAQAKNYDPDYYVNNQVLPAVMKILGALGFDEEGLKTNTKQKGLGGW
ncbi:MAG: DNA-directed DNA polymerase [Candidatus Micrarchaeota archaeon]